VVECQECRFRALVHAVFNGVPQRLCTASIGTVTAYFVQYARALVEASIILLLTTLLVALTALLPFWSEIPLKLLLGLISAV
jgi:hypothetical protein